MNYNELINIESEFISLSNELLESIESTFSANLLSLREFCESTCVISDILTPISKTNFNGIEYFCKKLNPGNRFENFTKPKNRNEILKVSYDILFAEDLSASNIWNYAIWVLHPDTKKIDELLSIGNRELFGKLINFINLELTKLINNAEKPSNPNQLTFNIENASGSIIGTQQNATINNSYNLDELKKIIDEKVSDSSDNQQLQELINMLKAITENNIPVQKGTLSRFSEALEKHSWVTGAIAQSLIGWMIGK